MNVRKLIIASISLAALTLTAPAIAQDEQTYPEMTFGEWGFDPVSIDPEVDPGDDFNAYANGKWVRQTELPADMSRFGSFDFLQEKSTEHIEALIDEIVASDPAPGTGARRILDAYEAYTNRQAIEAAGLSPAYPFLTKIYEAPDLAALARLFEQPGYPALLGAGVSLDVGVPGTHAVNIGFDGMGMNDREYYLEDNERNLEIRASYMKMLEFMLAKAGYQDPAAAAKSVYAFERKVAELEWDQQFLRNPKLRYNVLTQSELQALSPQFPVKAWLESGDFAQVDRFVVGQLPPTAEGLKEAGYAPEDAAKIGGGLPAMMDLLVETPLPTLKAYMAAQFLVGQAPVLPKDIYDQMFAFYGTAISGSKEPRPLRKRAIAATQGLIGEELAKLYVAKHFLPEAKAKVEELVANLSQAMRESLEENDWMTEATTTAALGKLDKLDTMIGYPEEFETYEGLEIRSDDPLGNRMRKIAWSLADMRAKLDEPVDRREWVMLPQTVNAYYMPPYNQIVFPAAILQPPFFDPDADMAVNYGAIGAVIGHEIGHGFDDGGSRYDADGALKNWWQDSDRQSFDAKGDKMAGFINAYCPLDDGQLCLTGRQSLGEVLGDSIGLQMAYRAYRNALDGEEAPVIDGLTGDQRFFLAFAQIWRSLERPEFQRMLLLSASHPPNEFRLNNAVRHIDAWYDAFNVTPDDALYLPPEERIKIW